MDVNIFKTKKAKFIGGLVLILILFLVSVFVFEYKYIGAFFPGVSLNDESLSGRSFSEVYGKIRVNVDELNQDGLGIAVKATAGNYLISIPQASYGLTPDMAVEYFNIGDWELILEKAYQRGRSGSIFKRVREQVELLARGLEVELPVIVREGTTKSLLKREFELALSEQRPASLKNNGSWWKIEKEIVGEYVDLDEVYEMVMGALAGLSVETLTVEAEQIVPSTTEASLGEYFNFITSDLIKKSVRFRFNGYNVWLSGSGLISWLRTNRDAGGGVSLLIDREKLATFVENKIAAYIENPARNARFKFIDGELIEIVKGEVGNAVNLDKLGDELDQMLVRVHEDFMAPVIGEEIDDILVLELSVMEQEPKITSESISRYGIEELVATAQTSFAGSSAARKNNIKVAAGKLNGLLIAPGEEFSAVNQIGYVTEEDGYEKEYVIKGNESIKELGGGLCQLATTLFRTALDGGLPITERQNHSYVVGYYGPGLDATIYGPHPDLKFVNDTGNYLLLQSKVENDMLVFELYGQDDDRVVTIGEPEIYDRIPPPEPKYIPSFELFMGQTKCTETARYGMTTEAEYTVEKSDGSSKTQIFKSVYRPWRKVCLIGVRKY